MAILRSGHLALEIRYRELDRDRWLQHDVWFRWGTEPLIRPELLKNDSAYWAGRAPGAFRVNEFERDGLLPVLERVLDKGEVDAWVPQPEPDFCLAFYPGQDFPPAATVNPPGQPLSVRAGWGTDARVTIIAMADVINLAGGESYPGDGPALVLTVTRAALKAFRADLAAEYVAFQGERRLNRE